VVKGRARRSCKKSRRACFGDKQEGVRFVWRLRGGVLVDRQTTDNNNYTVVILLLCSTPRFSPNLQFAGVANVLSVSFLSTAKLCGWFLTIGLKGCFVVPAGNIVFTKMIGKDLRPKN
jgi:hypothetical protein